MRATALDTWAMLGRQGRALMRQPIWIAILIVEPIVWITLFSQLFRRIVELPGFETDSYIQFLTPGIVVMAAFFSASWSGWNMLMDHDRGVLERFLATRVSRFAIVVSQVLRSSIIGVIKALLLVGIAHALGARVTAGFAGWLVLLLAAALISSVFAGISHTIALVVRSQDTLVAFVSFYALPLTFFSTSLIAEELMPVWMQWAARFNPVNWAVMAARETMSTTTDWSAIGFWLGLLVAGSVATALLATHAFRSYQRTL
ncbi:MAG: ABC transporter permease [Actinomycetia bacterium]|nr:ABC transporter permease [Actinomycetes bacterium]